MSVSHGLTSCGDAGSRYPLLIKALQPCPRSSAIRTPSPAQPSCMRPGGPRQPRFLAGVLGLALRNGLDDPASHPSLSTGLGLLAIDFRRQGACSDRPSRPRASPLARLTAEAPAWECLRISNLSGCLIKPRVRSSAQPPRLRTKHRQFVKAPRRTPCSAASSQTRLRSWARHRLGRLAAIRPVQCGWQRPQRPAFGHWLRRNRYLWDSSGRFRFVPPPPAKELDVNEDAILPWHGCRNRIARRGNGGRACPCRSPGGPIHPASWRIRNCPSS